MSSIVSEDNSPIGEKRRRITFEIGPDIQEALQDFAGTFGISLDRAAYVILTEYLDRAGYPVETVPYYQIGEKP